MMADDSVPNIPGYQIVKFIGSGANATVYLAVQESLNRPVALKILQQFERAEQAVRFFNEGQIVASMNHPNIITIYDIGTAGNQQYIAMEYMDGGSLRDRIKSSISPSEALDVVQSIAAALDFVHEQGIVHRDIKPENILFHKQGTLKITDFGVAKSQDRDMNLTMDGTALGSPYYLSPEQAQGRELDGRSDIYSLGVILFELLTGKQPYVGDSHIEVILDHLTKPTPSLPSEYQHYQGLVDKMMAKSPDDRFSSCGEMLDYINALRSIGGSRQDGRGIGLDQRSRGAGNPTTQSNDPGFRWWWGMAAIAVPVLVGLGIYLNQFSSAPESATVTSQAGQTSSVTPVARLDTVTERPKAAKVDHPQSNDSLEIEEQVPVANLTSAGLMSSAELTERTASMHDETAGGQQLQGANENTDAGLPEKNDIAQEDSSATANDTREQLTEAVEDNVQEVDEQVLTEPPNGPVEEWVQANDADLQSTALVADAVEDTTEEQIEALLAKAQTALAEYRLTNPKGNNAYYYYQQVLELDAQNARARKGISRIVSRYVFLADRALRRGREDRANLFVKRGLRLAPKNQSLLTLRQRLEALQAARNVPPPESEKPVVVTQPKPEPKPKPTYDGIRLLESLEW